MDTILTILGTVSAFAILCMSMEQLNRMSGKTSHTWRFSHLALSIGSAGMVIRPLWETTPMSVLSVLMLIGVAVAMVADRRKASGVWHRSTSDRRHSV